MSNLIIFYSLQNIWLVLLIKKKQLYYNDSKITEFERIDNKNSSTAYVVMYKLIT